MSQTKSSGSLIGKIGSYLQIVTKDPRSTAFVPLAEAYRQVGLMDDALEAAKLGTSMLPHFSPGFATLGRILGQMGRIDEAMSAYARALSIDRQSQAALVGLARLHLTRGERDQARKILSQAAEFHPQDEMVQNMLTALDLPRPWTELAKTPLAEPVAGEAAEELGSEPIPTATLAEIYVKQGLLDKAVKIYQDILRHSPDNQQAKARLAALQQPAEAPPRAAPQAPAPAASVAAVAPEPAAVSPSAPEPEAVQPKSVPFAGLSPMEILERWLMVIQQRRKHVQ